MPSNPFTRGTSPGRARPPHRGSFKRGHAKRGGRKKGTRNALSPRVRKAVEAATKRVTRGTTLTRQNWDWVIYKNPLIAEALEHQGKFTAAGAPRLRSRSFKMEAFCKALSAVAMRAIKTGQFADQDLVQCLRLLAVRDPGEFAKFVALTLPKQDYLAARPFAEITEPREAVNPGEYRRPAIPEWGLDLDLRFNSWMPVPIDRALTPQDAYHEICGSPVNPAPGWDWKFDNKGRCFRAIALRPKTPIPEWTQRFDPKLDAMTPVPVDPNVTPGQAYHSEYGSPLLPVPGWEWKFDSRTQRFIPLIMDELRYQERQFATLKLRLYRWHPDEGHYSLIRDDDDDWEEYKDDIYIYEYDAERPVFKRVAVVYEYDPNTDQYVRIAKSIE